MGRNHYSFKLKQIPLSAYCVKCLFMSAVDIAVQAFRKLEAEDHEILQVIEEQMKNYEYAPKDTIQNQSDLAPTEIDYRLPLLVKKRLLKCWRGKYTGFKLTTSGHDALAINALVNSNIIAAFGKPLGVGKESDVYEALTPDGLQVALKFHRLGRTSFKKTKLKRDYVVKYIYTPDWHVQSTISAKKEYAALRLLYPKGVAVPEPIKQNRHVLVMSMINGAELYRYPKLPDAQRILDDILANVKRAYCDVHLIHGDLSPFNILLLSNMHILIIDWPQNVSTKHPNSKVFLERDVQNILNFFCRKYEIKKQLKDVLIFIQQDIES